MSIIHTPLRCLLLACLLACVGCGNGLVPAQGQVKYEDGSPVKGPIRVIRFEPTEDSTAEVRKAASGRLSEDGSFSLMTFVPDDGVYRGEYTVTFTVIESLATGKSLIPEKYNHAETSPFKVTVDGGKDDYLFELTPLEAPQR